jgi:outer membrane protein TolC
MAVILAAPGFALAETVTLAGAIDRAIALAPSIDVAAASSDFSGAQAREAQGPLWPSIAAQGEYQQMPGFDPRITNRGQTDMLLTLDYPAYDFGRRLQHARAARYASEAAHFGLAAARAQVVFDAKAAYFDLLRRMHSEDELQASLDRLNRYIATAQALVQNGRAIPNDVLRVQVARDSTQLALAAAKRERERASAMLGLIIGEPGRTDLRAAEVEGFAPVPSGELAYNPALEAADRQIRSASLEERAAEKERYPTFKVALSAGFLGVDPQNTFNDRAGASYDGLISVPVFEGGAIAARIDQAKARVHQAEAQRREIELELTRRFDDASLRYREARDALDVLARAEPTARDAFGLTWARFLGGGGATMLEVLDSYQQLEQVRLNRIDQEFAAREADAETALVLGLSK